MSTPRREPEHVRVDRNDTPSSIAPMEAQEQPATSGASESNVENMLQRMSDMMDRIKELEDKLKNKE